VSANPQLAQSYVGRCIYHPDYGSDPDRLLVAIPRLLQGQPPLVFALLDKASPWSMLPASLSIDLGCDMSPDPYVPPLRTARVGRIAGRFERLWVQFPPSDGDPLDVLVTFYLSPDWSGPLVIGWKGCLEGLRFALDPGEDRFYFAPL